MRVTPHRGRSSSRRAAQGPEVSTARKLKPPPISHARRQTECVHAPTGAERPQGTSVIFASCTGYLGRLPVAWKPPGQSYDRVGCAGERFLPSLLRVQTRRWGIKRGSVQSDPRNVSKVQTLTCRLGGHRLAPTMRQRCGTMTSQGAACPVSGVPAELDSDPRMLEVPPQVPKALRLKRAADWRVPANLSAG